jgi:hypothetical protein
MALPSIDHVLRILKTGTPQDLADLLKPLSPSDLAVLATAVCKRADEMNRTTPDHIPVIALATLAKAHAEALSRLGRVAEAREVAARYITHPALSLDRRTSSAPVSQGPMRREFDTDDTLGLDMEAGEAGSADAPAAPPERRWLNAAIRDRKANEALDVGAEYVLEYWVDLKGSGDAATAVPSSELLFKPGEDEIELTILLTSSHFQIASPQQRLLLPRQGVSPGRARFEATAVQAGRGTITALVLKDGNFLLQMDVSYSIGAGAAEPPSTESFGRPIAAAATLQPRLLSLMIKPAPAGGYDCTMVSNGARSVVLPTAETELADAIKTARADLMSVITQRDTGSKLVFQTGIDIDKDSAAKALQTLAKAGARLFQRIFAGPTAGADVRQLGEWLRTRVMSANERLTVQVVSQRFPVPWGLLYFGKVDSRATLSWDNFLGMRCIVEQLPIVNSFVDDSVIRSDRPALAVSVNVNNNIDQKMGLNVVARQLEFWQASAGWLGAAVQVAQRQTRTDFLEALTAGSRDQLMYLYCHAVTAGPDDPRGISGSCLIFTGDERLTLDDLNFEAPTDQPLRGNPLVFINACESAELTPAFYDGFVPYFMAKSARGVIGTECKTPAVFATEWALRFFPRFLAGEPLGELFLGLRRDFCTNHNNPLGLLYAVYCDADTQIRPELTLQ